MSQNVIDISQKLFARQLHNTFSSLSKIVADHESEICRHPLKYFNEACAEIKRLRTILDKVRDAAALSRPVWSSPNDIPTKPKCIKDESFEQLTNLRELIDKEYPR